MACSLGPRCAFVVGLVTLSYRVAQWLSSASAGGSIRVSSGHVRSHRQQQKPSQLKAPSWDSAPSYPLGNPTSFTGTSSGRGGRDCGEKPMRGPADARQRPPLVRRATEIERVPSLRPSPITERCHHTVRRLRTSGYARSYASAAQMSSA